MGPRCSQEVRAWLEAGGCADLGVPDFGEQFELSSFLAWSRLKDIEGDKR